MRQERASVHVRETAGRICDDGKYARFLETGTCAQLKSRRSRIHIGVYKGRKRES